jgi:hypothetical protein
VAVQARGYDDLPPEVLESFERTHIGSLEPDALRAALASSVAALLDQGSDADVSDVDVVAERLSELVEDL